MNIGNYPFNKLQKNLTVRIYFKVTKLYDAIERLRSASTSMQSYFKDIKPCSNKVAETEIMLAWLAAITMNKPRSLLDLVFPESFSIVSDGFDFFDMYGNFYGVRKYKGSYYIWVLLQSETWCEPGCKEPLYKRLKNVAYNCNTDAADS